MKNIAPPLLTFAFLGLMVTASAQTITLEYCHQKAEELSPLAKQRLQQETIETLNEKSTSTAYLPKINFSGQASYQSDVISFPNSPVFETPIIPKDQYKLMLELTQSIYDGGMAKNQKLVEQAQSNTQMQSVEVNIYQIKSAIDQLYFAGLLAEKNAEILHSTYDLLQDQLKTLKAQVAHGVMMKSAEDNFTKQILSTEQQIAGIEADHKAALQMLGNWIGQEIDQNTRLAMPQMPDSLMRQESINRPEVGLYKAQQQYYGALSGISSAQRRPKFMLFAQGGYGSPNPLNFFETDFADFYMVGLKLNWNILDYGNVKRDKEMNLARQQIAQSNLDNFEDNISRQMLKANQDIEKMDKVLKTDDDIVAIQKRITERSFNQLKNGTITPSEYFTELNDKTQAELTRQMHLIQLKQAQYRLLTISGNN